MQMYLDKVAPSSEHSAIAVCTGTVNYIEFSSRSNTTPLTSAIREKDIQHLTYLIDSTRTAISALAREFQPTIMKVTPSLTLDIISELVSVCARVPVIDDKVLATQFLSLFRALFLVGVTQSVVQGAKELATHASHPPSTSAPTNYITLGTNSSSTSTTTTTTTSTTTTTTTSTTSDASNNQASQSVTLTFGEAYLQRICELAKIDSSCVSKLAPYIASLHTFTRSAAILYAALFSIPLPSIQTSDEEFATLLEFLHLSPQKHLQSLPAASESFVAQLISSYSPTPVADICLLGSPTPFSLVPLPKSYYEFAEPPLDGVLCKTCSQRPFDISVCLICGDAVCTGCLCCRDSTSGFGEGALHAKQCCGDFGVYFVIDKGLVIIMFKGITCSYFSPYLDPHGEEDLRLERGLPLSLNKERYDHLAELVASHSISSKVLARAESRYRV